jgi:threonylcarbamoyladenosine tRNA methylthiotransferase MtaB
MPQLPRPVISARRRPARRRGGSTRPLAGARIGRPKRVSERDGTGHAENFARIALPPARPGQIMPSHPHTYQGLLA